MPATEVVLYCEADGAAPFLTWLDKMPRKVQDKCIVRIERLKALGYEMRRPEKGTLRGGICELRVRHMNVNYRILYFHHGKRAVISHGISKEKEVPASEIDRALRRRKAYGGNPDLHTHRGA